jgi:hypothetical protein
MLLFLLSLQSCLDMFDKAPEKFVGNVYVRTSPNNGEAFFMYGKDYKRNGTYTLVINEPLLAAVGNDSIIYLKTQFMSIINYYFIKHKEGKTLSKTVTIDSIQYNGLTKGVEFKYKYFTTQPR